MRAMFELVPVAGSKKRAGSSLMYRGTRRRSRVALGNRVGAGEGGRSGLSSCGSVSECGTDDLAATTPAGGGTCDRRRRASQRALKRLRVSLSTERNFSPNPPRSSLDTTCPWSPICDPRHSIYNSHFVPRVRKSAPSSAQPRMLITRTTTLVPTPPPAGCNRPVKPSWYRGTFRRSRIGQQFNPGTLWAQGEKETSVVNHDLHLWTMKRPGFHLTRLTGSTGSLGTPRKD
jgi:hypothetical protein